MKSNPFFAIACVLDKVHCFSLSYKAAAAQQMLIEAYEKMQPTQMLPASEIKDPGLLLKGLGLTPLCSLVLKK